MSMRLFKRGVGLTMLAVLCGSILSPAASALIGPDSADGFPVVQPGASPAKASYVVSKDNFTDIGSTKIKVYVPRTMTSRNITLYNSDMCSNAGKGTNNSFDQTFQGADGGAGTGLVTTYRITSGGRTVSPAVSGEWNGSATCDDREVTITLTGGVLDTKTNMFAYDIEATANQSQRTRFVNLFWFSSGSMSDGVIFSQDTTGGAGARDFGYQLSSPIPAAGNNPTSVRPQPSVYYDTMLLFGADCSVNSATKAIISLYDDDNSGSNQGVQPRKLNVQLVEFNRDLTGRRVVNLALERGTSSSTAQLRNIGGSTYEPSSGTERGTINVSFTANPNKIYKFYLNGVYYNNTLQFALPFETVYGYVGCQRANLVASSQVDQPIILPGQTATWRHSLTNRDPIGTASGVTAEVRRSILDINGNTTQTTVGAPMISNGTLGPGQSVPPRSDSFAATPSDVGKTICEWVEFRWAGGSGRSPTRPCTIVGKQPKLQIWGGDARVGGAVDTSSASISVTTYGSWVEYGAFIGGVNRGNRFGSGASLAGGVPAGATPLQRNSLTFANTGITGDYGQYGTMTLQNQTLATNMARLNVGGPGGNIAGAVSLSRLATGRYTATNNVTLQGSVGPGTTIIIDALRHDVTIDQNITYSGAPYANIDQIPQVIILARNININDSVQTVDAWLIATNTGNAMLNTCANQRDISISICNAKLTVNGPVATDRALFKRTAGSDDEARAGDPAELLNLRADAYLWKYAQARRNATPLTVKVTELPPRY